MAMLDIPHFAPPRFDPDKDDFRCFIFRFKEYCALYKLNVGMPRRHLLIQALPDEAIRRILDHYGSNTVHDQHQVNWCTFDEMVHILEKMYCKPIKVDTDDSDEDDEETETAAVNDEDEEIAQAARVFNEMDLSSINKMINDTQKGDNGK
uniref:ARID domain-containing protein n=1 Tax=Panagrellus redivivus TaxID=6233 RepID=A0A7E4UP09_PANRE